MPDENHEGEENTEELLIKTMISPFTGLAYNHRQIPKELSAGKDFNGETANKPTQTYPGTTERIEVYLKRSELGLPIFNALDKKVNHGFDTEVS